VTRFVATATPASAPKTLESDAPWRETCLVEKTTKSALVDIAAGYIHSACIRACLRERHTVCQSSTFLAQYQCDTSVLFIRSSRTEPAKPAAQMAYLLAEQRAKHVIEQSLFCGALSCTARK